jgi:hypothetical protein
MATTTDQRRVHYDAFVAEVVDLCRDNGIRARLETGGGQPVDQCHKLHRHLTHRVAGHGAKRAHYTVASLIALQPPAPAPAAAPRMADTPPEPRELFTDPTAPATPAVGGAQGTPWRARANLGTTLALAVRRGGFRPGPTEERLETLVRLDADLLQPLLPGQAKRLLRAGIPIDWAVLLEDLAWWDYDHDQVTTRWRESFYFTVESLTLPQEP